MSEEVKTERDEWVNTVYGYVDEVLKLVQSKQISYKTAMFVLKTALDNVEWTADYELHRLQWTKRLKARTNHTDFDIYDIALWSDTAKRN